jgi:hypothetical protein
MGQGPNGKTRAGGIMKAYAIVGRSGRIRVTTFGRLCIFKGPTIAQFAMKEIRSTAKLAVVEVEVLSFGKA